MSKRSNSAGFSGKSVFITVGTTEFDALVREVCRPATVQAFEDLGFRRMTIQIGRGVFEPPSLPSGSSVHMEWYRYKESIQADFNSADLIVSHAGAGTCLEALDLRKKLLVVVNETLHDNHQVELASQLASEGYLAFCVPADLSQTLQNTNFDTLKPWEKGRPEKFGQWLDNALGV